MDFGGRYVGFYIFSMYRQAPSSGGTYFFVDNRCALGEMASSLFRALTSQKLAGKKSG
jgi:hypothetical protein